MAEKKDEGKKPSGLFGSTALGILLRRWKEGTFGEILEDWRWILTYTKQYKWAVACYVVLGIASSSLSLVSAVASKYTIDIITGYQTSKLAAMAAVMVGSSLASLALRSLISRVSAKISLYVGNDIQASVFDKILDADWLELSRYVNGDMLNRFNSDVSTVASNAVSWLPSIVIGLYTFLATFFVILHYDLTMAFIALASAPFLLLSSRYLLKRMRRHSQEVKELSSKLMAFEVEAFYNLDTIKSFGLMDRYGKGLRDRQETYKKASLDYNWFSIKTGAVLSLLGLAVQFTGFGYCLYLLWSGKILYGTMTLFLTQGTKLTSSFNALVKTVPTFLSASVSAHRIRELTELVPEPVLPQSGELLEEAADGVSVVMEEMSLAYEGERWVLDGVAFRAEPGEIVALIGQSGGGKTTMIRTMLGLIAPGRGRAFLRGRDGREVAMNAALRGCFSYVPQGNTMISGTVAENLRMVAPSASDEKLERALRAACAWEFVEKMPGGLQAAVGERGHGLSEGQAQRIAIARALLRDAPVLLLDEATSALDVATERRVLRSLMQSHPNKTCIVTTHRPTVIGLCERVYQVGGGTVRELGEQEAQTLAMEF